MAVGIEAVRLAREAIEQRLRGEVGPNLARSRAPPGFEERRGVFVTLRAPGGLLRGCVGFPRPLFPLHRSIREAALAAAFGDPRFPPLSSRELPSLSIEVSILTPPEPIHGRTPAEIARQVRIGTDGLIVGIDDHEGLLLPQVAVEQGWEAIEFLAGTCEKAGLPADAWLRPGTRILRFQGEVFLEASPGGTVRRGLSPEPTPGFPG